MASFSARSKEKLATCHSDIQLVMNEAIEIYDFTILCGYRNEEAQNKAFNEGHSNKQYPDSTHNQKPSISVDIAPYPIDWKNVEEFYFLAGIIMTVAKRHNIKLIWGGRWTSLKDCPHFQLVLEKP
jgi:peptidoglycan L-alanyl-D-glutamate endopeptidase CwlK